MGTRIGIPRALFYYKYQPFYQTFFETLGAEVVFSAPTSRKILDAGVKACVNEACLPIKLFHGHVIDLQDKVDYLFIPRFTSVSRNEYICPKFGGLPDLIRCSIPQLPPLITTEIDLHKSTENAWNAAVQTGRLLNGSRRTIRQAFERAMAAQEAYEEGLVRDPGPHKATLRVAVIGHPYLLYDEYASMKLMDKLNTMGLEVVTPEMVPEASINLYAASLSKPVFWTVARKAVGSAFHIINECNPDGMIYVMSFGCGIDSFIGDLIERRVRRMTTLPFITVTIDEHSGEAGLNTRLEAFLDMLEWRKTNEHNISAFG